jgi:hypothetical protein
MNNIVSPQQVITTRLLVNLSTRLLLNKVD